jgi:GT2 family glycosyltransferase
MIYYFTPFDYQKRLGLIHNEYCKLVSNPNDWICILDPDTMFLHPHQQAFIEQIVNKHGDKWDLLGCMTNRIGNPSNLQDTNIDNDILSAIDKAKNAFTLHKDSIKETDITAGFFMLFKRSLWDKVKFEQGIDFDIKFCKAVKKIGGRIGIMQGIYIWHTYRLGHDNPKKYKKHLL